MSTKKGDPVKATKLAKAAKPIATPLDDSDKFQQFMAEKLKAAGRKKRRAAIFTHKIPDPDAIGAQIALAHLLGRHYGVESDLFEDGEVSHPQNKIAVQLLDPHLIPTSEYKPTQYILRILVDAIPSNAGIGDHTVDFDIVVDHHKDLPTNFDGLCIHHHSGSTCGIIYDLLKGHGIKFDADSEEDAKVATAIMAGVITDTNHCMSADTTTFDFAAQQGMFRYWDADALRKIIHFKRSMSWIKLRGKAINEVEIREAVAVVGLGELDSEQKDVIADIASDMMTWSGVHTAIVFALFDGKRIQGSMRTIEDTVQVQSLCASLAGDSGEGGGKSYAGGYTKSLGSFALRTDEKPEIKAKFWEITKEREIEEIFKLMNK